MSRCMVLAGLLLAAGEAAAIGFEAVFIDMRGEESRRPLTAQERSSGVWVCTLRKDRIPSGIQSFEIRCDWATASAGEPGWWMAQRGDVGSFDPTRTNSFSLASAPWVWLPYYAMKTPRRTFIAILDGMRFEPNIVMEIRNGRWAAFPRYPVRNLGVSPYEDVTVTVYELPTEAGYVEMAKTYRRHRMERDASIRPLKARMLDSSHLAKLARSLPLRRMHAIKPGRKDKGNNLDFTPEDEPAPKLRCTFADTLEMLKLMKAEGLDDIALCVSGWQTGGYDGRCPSAFPVIDICGGEAELRKLIAGGQALGYIIDGHSNYTDVFTCSPLWNGGDIVCKGLNGELEKNGIWAGGQAYNLCLCNAWATFLPEQLERTAALGFRGCHYVDVFTAGSPYRCLDPRHPANRNEQADVERKIADRCRSLFGGFASEMCMDHLLGRVDYINYASTSLRSLDEAKHGGKPFRAEKVVPFFELAYHDVVLYSVDRWTQGYVTGDRALKTIEFGGRPILYTFDRKSLPKLKTIYREFLTYRHLLTEEMTGHCEVACGVFRTDYANGESTFVNYNDRAVSVGGVSVPAKDWTLVGKDMRE